MASKKKFELLTPVWQNGSEQMPAGTVVTFDKDEPTGIFVDRVKELTEPGAAVEVASPDVDKTPEAVPTPPSPKK